MNVNFKIYDFTENIFALLQTKKVIIIDAIPQEIRNGFFSPLKVNQRKANRAIILKYAKMKESDPNNLVFLLKKL